MSHYKITFIRLTSANPGISLLIGKEVRSRDDKPVTDPLTLEIDSP